MTTEPKKRDPFTDWRPAAGTRRDCGELELTISIDRDNYFTIIADPDTVAMVPVVLRQILAQPEPEGLSPCVGHILRLAEIIREVDGNHDKGAAALAEAILSHPGSRWQSSLAQPEP